MTTIKADHSYNERHTGVTSEVLDLLTFSRSRQVEAIRAELGHVLASLRAMQEAREFPSECPDSVPDWMRIAIAEAVTPSAVVDWAICRAHVSKRTADGMRNSLLTGFTEESAEAFAQLGILRSLTVEGTDEETPAVPPADLAKAFGIDLEEFAARAWAGVGEVSNAANEETI